MFITSTNNCPSDRKAKPYILLHIPSKLALETMLQEKNKSKLLHSYAYICHTILQGYLSNLKLKSAVEDRRACSKYVPLDSRILRKMLTRNKATAIIKDLIAWRVIERNDTYSVTTATISGSCKGYRFTEGYRNSDIRWIQLQNRPMWKKLQQQREEQQLRQQLQNSTDHTLTFLHQQLHKLRINLPAAFEQVLKQEGNIVPSAENTIYRIGRMRPAEATPGQLHTPDTPVLPHLLFSDITPPSSSSCTPYLPSYVVSFSNFMRLGRLSKFYRSSTGQEPWEFKVDRKTGRLFTNLTNLPRTFRKHLYLESHERMVVVDIGECQPFMFSIMLMKRAREIWGEIVPEDVQKYIQLTGSRNFYRYIMDKCGVAAEQRDVFKQQVFGSIFYCSKWIAESEGNKPGSIFISSFPNVYRILNESKGNGGTNELPVRLMRLESEIILHDVCARTAQNVNDSFFVATIHDGIVTTASRAQQVKLMIEEACRRRLGHIPTVKPEPFNYMEDELISA
ncbi:hypothetical protein [Pontibacter liquoris]|uniref:hypothetical protein n=1 Tax=Pontibacter liquoris TaxID=2905677 RepID=UPI001FA77CFB|nr:hypothetical protein [Pontibacter liquoris]